MSSIVALKFFAGRRTARQEKALSNLLKPFKKAGRLGDPGSCVLSGSRASARGIAGGWHRNGAHRRQVLNDVLIAVTAGRTGMVVVTGNAADFALIEKHMPVRWMLPD